MHMQSRAPAPTALTALCRTINSNCSQGNVQKIDCHGLSDQHWIIQVAVLILCCCAKTSGLSIVIEQPVHMQSLKRSHPSLYNVLLLCLHTLSDSPST